MSHYTHLMSHAASPTCSVRIPENLRVFFSTHNGETYELLTCTREKIFGTYNDLYYLMPCIKHQSGCTYEKFNEADQKAKVQYPGDCTLV